MIRACKASEVSDIGDQIFRQVNIVELQMVSNLRSLSAKQKDLELQSVRRACDDLERRGAALWQGTGAEIRQWNQNVTDLERLYEAESALMRIGRNLPSAIEHVASQPQFAAADWQLVVAA